MKPSILPTLLLVSALSAQGSEPQPATDNQCVLCHRDPATLRAQPKLMGHVFEHWYGSVHGRHQVGCDRCHGGDPAKKSKEEAHAGVEPASVKTSKIYYRNLPETCGSCHQEVSQQFSRSDHFTNLQADRLAPTCTTCHGFEMEIESVRPREIADRCTVCHNKRMNVHPEIQDHLEDVVAAIRTAETTVKLAAATVELAQQEGLPMDKPAAELAEARKRLRATGGLWHRFELQSFETELEQIRIQAEAARMVARKALLAR